MFDDPLLQTLLVIWAAVTVVLVVLLIVRSVIGMKEDDQLFLDPAEAKLEEEQKQIQVRLKKLAPFVTGFSVTSVGLLLVVAGIWLYRGLQNF